jgi:hypothetical protein
MPKSTVMKPDGEGVAMATSCRSLADFVSERVRAVLAAHQPSIAPHVAAVIGLKVEDDLRRRNEIVLPRVPTARMRAAADRLRKANPDASLDVLWAVMIIAAEL